MTLSIPQIQPQPSPPPLTTASRIIIVGAGTFGLSMAFHLLCSGYTDVTVLDRAKDLPAVDAASTDINKVVRSCYSDVFYTKMAREAMEVWRHPMWEGCYHECGVVNVGRDKFDDRLRENDRESGALNEDLPDAKAIQRKLLSSLCSTQAFVTSMSSDWDSNAWRVGPFTNYSGYFNPEGGWAEAARAVGILLSHVKEMGGKVIENQEIVGLMKDESDRTTGVKCRDGKRFEGDRVILTIGPWTASTFPELELDSKCLATGQSVATIQLNTEERVRYEGCHVYLDFESGFYILPAMFLRGVPLPMQITSKFCGKHTRKEGTEEIRPPTEDGTVKLAIHTAGHTHMTFPKRQGGDVDHHPDRKISTPRTITSHPNSGDGLRVPRSALRAIRKELGKVYPELAQKSWAKTRMCWYTDSPDGNWVIGYFPGDPTLFLATSGSGHAFKFLPNVGRLIVASLEGTLDAATAARFAIDRDFAGAKNSERASHVTQELDIQELCGPDEDGVPVTV